MKEEKKEKKKQTKASDWSNCQKNEKQLLKI